MSLNKIKLKRNSDGKWEVSGNSDSPKRKNLIEIKTWKNRKCIDLLHVMNKYKNRVKERLFIFLENNQPIKFYLNLKVTMKKTDFKTGEELYQEVHFHSRTKILLISADFDNTYEECAEKIWRGFDNWLVTLYTLSNLKY